MRRPSFVRHILPVVAGGALFFAVWSIASADRARPLIDPASPPPSNPFASAIAGSGLIEPSSEIVAVATELGGVVVAIHAKEGDDLPQGAALFEIDARIHRANLLQAEAREASAAAALARLDRQIAQQRATAAQIASGVTSAAAERERAEADRARFQELSRNDFASRQRLDSAVADSRRAEAGLTGARAGAEAARRQVEVLEAQRVELEATKLESAALRARAAVDVERATVRAPLAGRVLQLNVRLGEFAVAGAPASPLALMGNVAPLHVRVDIDEVDAQRLRPGARALARLRGDSRVASDLAFVRVEPYVVPKRSLTGGTSERVDTRVLQAIYAVLDPAFPAFVGQQVDVFVEAAPRR
jgi:multidrug resistance efflux pump